MDLGGWDFYGSLKSRTALVPVRDFNIRKNEEWLKRKKNVKRRIRIEAKRNDKKRKEKRSENEGRKEGRLVGR